jgi:hypothetical protein
MKVEFRLRFLGILRFLTLEVPTFVYVFHKNAIHEKTSVIFNDCND